MKWREAKPGTRLLVKDEVWTVVAVEDGAVTMRHPLLGERTGTPPPDAEVSEADPEPLGPISDERAAAAAARVQVVAKDNEVSPADVAEAQVKVTLGATTIARLRQGEPPQCPKPEVMDAQTFRNHLHHFHDTYPEASISVEELSQLHATLASPEPHEHTLPF